MTAARGNGSLSRMQAPGGGMRNRRGAIVVMAGIFIVALMMIAAISVDASRIFAAKNELQTASDAAALAGAIQLLDDSSTALDSARAYAWRNRVEQDSVDTVETVPGVWHPLERQFIAYGEPWDAVRVTTRHQLPLSLARVFGDSTVTVTATAVAWSSGPVMEPQCLKPLAVPYNRLLQILDYPAGSDIQLNDDDIRRLRDLPRGDKEWHFHYADRSNEDGNAPDEYGEDHFRRDQYFPIDIDSTWDRNDPSMELRPSVDPTTYQSYLRGLPDGRCSARVRSGDQVRSEPEPKINAVRDGLGEICASLGGTLQGSSTLTCRAGTTPIDMPLRVVYWSGGLPNPEVPPWDPGGQRSVLVTRMTGSFVVQRLDWNDGDNITHGRMHGYFDVQQDFGVVSDTSSSTLVRPVLVQ